MNASSAAAAATPAARLRTAVILGRLLVHLLIIGLASLLLLLASMLALWLHGPSYPVVVGDYRDEFFLSGTHLQETTADGTSYRWTTGDATLRIAHPQITRDATLTLDLGGRPQPTPLMLTRDGQPWVTFEAQTDARQYTLLLPESGPEPVSIGLRTETFAIAGDPRPLGVKIEGFTLAALPSGPLLPGPTQFAWQFVGLLAAYAAATRVTSVRWKLAAIAALLAIGLAALLALNLPVVHQLSPQVAVAGIGLLVATIIVLPRLERLAASPDAAWSGGAAEMRVLWGLMLLACGLRVVGVLNPTFDGQDLGRNVGRFLRTVTGDLIIIGPSSEFAKGITIYPTGPYLVFAPLMTFLRDLPQTFEAGLAIMEGSSSLAIALLARRFGAGTFGGRAAALLYLGNIASFSGLTYQFSAQLFGQWLTAPIALLILWRSGGARAREWLLVVLLMQFALYSHIGVSILAVSWIGLMLLVVLLRERTRAVLGVSVVYAISGLLALGLLYIYIFERSIAHAGGVTSSGISDATLFPGASPLMLRGARLTYTDVGLVLLPIGLVLAWRRLGAWQLLPVLAALAIALGFLVVNAMFDLQVRYFYFFMPFGLALIATALQALAGKRRATRLLCWAIVIGLASMGAWEWIGQTFGATTISMTPLTH